MSTTLIQRTTLSSLTCANCHIEFAIPAQFMADRRLDHKDFFCPLGHINYYPGKSDVEKLRDQLAAEKHRAEQAQALAEHRRKRIEEEQEHARRIARRLSATQGVVTRHKKKIAAGRCPCCSVKFKDLATHMQTEHPNWNPEKEAEVRSA